MTPTPVEAARGWCWRFEYPPHVANAGFNRVPAIGVPCWDDGAHLWCEECARAAGLIPEVKEAA
jgi:hypothetical protein